MFANIYKAINTDFPCETMKMNGQAFNRAFRNEVRKQLKKYGYTLLNGNGGGWCEARGFITDGVHYIYFNSGDFRWDDWENRMLIRGCESPEDFKGYANNFIHLKNIGEWCDNYFKRHKN